MSKLKITSTMVGQFKIHELYLPNGQCVASGSLEHCEKERDQWDAALNSYQPIQLELNFR